MAGEALACCARAAAWMRTSGGAGPQRHAVLHVSLPCRLERLLLEMHKKVVAKTGPASAWHGDSEPLLASSHMICHTACSSSDAAAAL